MKANAMIDKFQLIMLAEIETSTAQVSEVNFLKDDNQSLTLK